MRVYISSDIEGTTCTTIWDETRKDNAYYPAAARQMTLEVAAAAEGAFEAGADYVLIKDSHGSATNLDLNLIPEGCEVIRGWSGSPMCMADGCDESFDAALFIGYHSAAGRDGNPLSHTFSGKTNKIRLNGKICSEFLLYSYACAMKGVPTVFLSGDKMLTEDFKDLHPCLKTVAVKDGLGGLTKSLQPKTACKLIKQTVAEALKQDLSSALVKLPEHFVLEITYKEQRDAVKYSYYPGFTRIGETTNMMETDDFEDILRCVPFVF